VSVQTFEQFGKTCFTVASEYPNHVLKILDKIATRTRDNIKSKAPVDKGELQKSVVKEKIAGDTISVKAKAKHGIYVDKGHKTRQGTGRAPNYKPKQGGKTFVPANPFFSSEVNKLKQGELGETLAKDLADMFRRV